MATEAQIAANQRNAQASTGARTAEGKARVSRNATTFGIYSAGDVVRPDEKHLYRLFCEGFQQDLAPQGAMEITLAAEITHAAWRLRRCAAAESALELQSELDPMVDPQTTPAQNSIDRARAQAHRNFQRASAELRRLQTERQVRLETLPDNFDATTLGLCSCKEMGPVMVRDLRRQLLLHKRDQAEILAAVSELPPTKQTQSEAPQPRNSPCPCGSGAKYKRCCGTNAPAVLSTAA
jgi:hypothetical protein